VPFWQNLNSELSDNDIEADRYLDDTEVTISFWLDAHSDENGELAFPLPLITYHHTRLHSTQLIRAK